MSFCFLTKGVNAAEVTPVFDFRFFGGQHYFQGDASSLSGNINALFTPAVKFNDKWALYPTYNGDYQGTRNVQELAGGGTLFQDSSAHSLTAKTVYEATQRLKLKMTLGARAEFLRETQDEGWGSGLFDYRKFSGGLEAEYGVAKGRGGRLAYDHYMLNFPNYQSLESSQDPTLSRELAGENVLDTSNHMYTVGFWSPLPARGRAELSVYYTQRMFNDQPVVAASGDLTGTDRSDTLNAASLNMSWPFMLAGLRFFGEMGLGYAAQDSNQNHYDARKTAYLVNYYDYTQTSISPRLTTALGPRPWMISLAGSYTSRKYADRPTQDPNGDYLTSKLDFAETSVSLGLAYPVSKHVKARMSSSLAWSDSNMQYDKVFQYNYKIANYLFGFSYEF